MNNVESCTSYVTGVRGFVITFGFKKSTVESSRVGVGFRLFVDCKFGMISFVESTAFL